MDQTSSDLTFDFAKIYSDKGLILATSGAVIAAAAFRIAASLKLNTCYFSVRKNNWGYLSGFVLVGAICFMIFKFNHFQGSMVVQDPQEVIKNTPISWFGIGGVVMGLSYSLSLQHSILFQISSWLDAVRLALFVVTAKLVHGLLQPFAETESLSFIYEFDYKMYNMIILVLAGIMALFCFGKKLFLGVILGAGLICSQALFKDKLLSIYFLVFVGTFNILCFISNPKSFKQDTRASKIKEKEPQAATQSPQQLSNTQDEQEKKQIKDDGNKISQSPAKGAKVTTNADSNTQDNNPQKNDSNINPQASAQSQKSSSKSINKSANPQKTTSKSKKPVQNQQPANAAASGNVSVWRIIAGSILGGAGYGICGTVPETALLDFAVFTPHVTLVYIVSFIVGFTMLSAILAIIEFDTQESIEDLIQDELLAQELLEKAARKSSFL